jgi:3-oxoacyl-[acyl-carrier-protein] synthase II
LNDSAETMAINRLEGVRLPSLPVSSTKASVGHLLGAAGAVEVVICLMAMQGGWVPPTATLQEIDSTCRFRVPREPEDLKLRRVLSNSFGFGGANASVLLSPTP